MQCKGAHRFISTFLAVLCAGLVIIFVAKYVFVEKGPANPVAVSENTTMPNRAEDIKAFYVQGASLIEGLVANFNLTFPEDWGKVKVVAEKMNDGEKFTMTSVDDESEMRWVKINVYRTEAKTADNPFVDGATGQTVLFDGENYIVDLWTDATAYGCAMSSGSPMPEATCELAGNISKEVQDVIVPSFQLAEKTNL